MQLEELIEDLPNEELLIIKDYLAAGKRIVPEKILQTIHSKSQDEFINPITDEYSQVISKMDKKNFIEAFENNIEISLKGGYIDHKDIIISPEEANNLKPGEVTILCTGSQGEPLAALSRIANASHRQIKLQDDDVVIFSSSPIPGNALSVSRTINKLYLKGVEVYTNTSLKSLYLTYI